MIIFSLWVFLDVFGHCVLCHLPDGAGGAIGGSTAAAVAPIFVSGVGALCVRVCAGSAPLSPFGGGGAAAAAAACTVPR